MAKRPSASGQALPPVASKDTTVAPTAKIAKKYVVKRYHISSKDREYFTGNLAILLQSGVSVSEGLTSLVQTSSANQFKLAIQQIQRDIDEGMALWKALDRSGIVSAQTLALVQLGEQSGNLVQNLMVAAKQEEKQRIFRSKVRSALIYPSFVLSLTAIIGLGVAWFLLPKLAETFNNLQVELPYISQLFIGFGVFLRDEGLWAVPVGVVVTLVIVYVLFFAPKTRVIGQNILFHTPGISRLMYEVEIARFGYLLGTLLNAGLSVMQALELLGRATTAVRYQALYAHLHDSFENGYSFRNSLPSYKRSQKLIPPAVQQMVIAGEQSGALPETLARVGEIYEEKADISTSNLEAMIEPLLLLVVWVGVIGVAVAVILPIYSLVGSAGV